MITQRLIAHRGWQNCYPENTAISIEKAITSGAQNIEFDIQLSADHIPYLCHDHQLNRLCNTPESISQLTSEQIQTLSVYEPERFGQQFINTPICSLSQCVQQLATHPQITIYAEIKKHAIQTFGPKTCLTAILSELYRIQQQCVLISFDIDILFKAKQTGWNRVGAVLSNWQQAFEKQIAQLTPEIIFCDQKLLTDQKAISDIPFPVAVYEIGSYEKALTLLKQGAQRIETFRIGELIEKDKHLS